MNRDKFRKPFNIPSSNSLTPRGNNLNINKNSNSKHLVNTNRSNSNSNLIPNAGQRSKSNLTTKNNEIPGGLESNEHELF